MRNLFHGLEKLAAKSILVLLGASSLLLTGCGVNLADVSAGNSYSSPATVQGTLHGGQQPIAFATVKLYAAGTTGYGSAGILLATTTSSSTGVFYFTKSGTNGTSTGTTSSFACPATAADPQIYLIATGGNAIGNGLNDSADTNGNIALMTALGPCSQITNSEFLVVDERSTAATATATRH